VRTVWTVRTVWSSLAPLRPTEEEEETVGTAGTAAWCTYSGLMNRRSCRLLHLHLLLQLCSALDRHDRVA